MTVNRGKLIVFEGVDATGKTSLCKELINVLQRGHEVVRYCHFPGKKQKTLGELVDRIHHFHSTKFEVPTINPCSLQLLHIAAHVDTIESEILPALSDGEVVVLDRFWWSTYVYGLDNGVQELQLRHMINIEKCSWDEIKPDIIFLVDSPNPLRDDVTDSFAWQSKRQKYRQLMGEDHQQKCVLLETGKERNVQELALSKIKEAIAALFSEKV